MTARLADHLGQLVEHATQRAATAVSTGDVDRALHWARVAETATRAWCHAVAGTRWGVEPAPRGGWGDCPTCSGAGFIDIDGDGAAGPQTCPTCDGSRYLNGAR